MVRPAFRACACAPLALAAPSAALIHRRTPSLRPAGRRRAATTELRGAAVEPAAVLSRAAEVMQRVMTEDFFSRSPSLGRMRASVAKSVEVRPSSIAGAGNGLFATRNLKAGTLVSFYPAHCLGAELGGGEVWATAEEDREYFAAHPHASSAYLHATDQPIFGRPSVLQAARAGGEEGSVCYLDVNPNRGVDAAWVSHYINDGATVEEGTEAGVTKYYGESKARKNCVHAPFGPSPILATVATRKIKKGEELLTSYGCVYWLGALATRQGGAEDAPGMTGVIQSQIRESAEDLFRCMKSVRTTYAKEMEDLETTINSLLNQD